MPWFLMARTCVIKVMWVDDLTGNLSEDVSHNVTWREVGLVALDEMSNCFPLESEKDESVEQEVEARLTVPFPFAGYLSTVCCVSIVKWECPYLNDSYLHNIWFWGKNLRSVEEKISCLSWLLNYHIIESENRTDWPWKVDFEQEGKKSNYEFHLTVQFASFCLPRLLKEATFSSPLRWGPPARFCLLTLLAARIDIFFNVN